MSDEILYTLASIQESLQQMEQKLSGVSANVENLKMVTKLPGEGNSDSLHSNPQTQSVSQPGNSEDRNHVVREAGSRIRG